MTTMNKAPQTLKGFRDFLPEEKRKRDFVAAKIRQTFEAFGFEPIETPTLEYADLLLGKYGAEADKLVYTFEDRGGRRVGLRYDQTVPTARVIAQNQNPDVLPTILRRYQIQNVFRADKPQKGRYREFTQCDIDLFGSNFPTADAEILACTYQTYKNIGFKNIKVKINDRQILFDVINKSGISEDKVFSVIQSLDKLDKKSIEEVQAELEKKGVSPDQFQTINNLLREAKPDDNLNNIIEISTKLGVSGEAIEFVPYLARGLDYYTGMIFEIIIPEFTAGSVGGGGRYDDLIETLCNIKITAVGMAFGFDRTVEAADQLGLIPKEKSITSVFVTVLPDTMDASFETARILRSNNINTELAPLYKENVNFDEVFNTPGFNNKEFANTLGKQLKYADKKGIPFVLIIGQEELSQNKLRLKDMGQGSENKGELLTMEEIIALLKS